MLLKVRIKRLRKKIKENHYQTELLTIQYNYQKIGDGLYEYFRGRYQKEYFKLVQKLVRLQQKADGRYTKE